MYFLNSICRGPFFFCSFIFLLFSCKEQESWESEQTFQLLDKSYSLLAIGDSLTVGALASSQYQNFPGRVLSKLQELSIGYVSSRAIKLKASEYSSSAITSEKIGGFVLY